jgi:hypothetical protein
MQPAVLFLAGKIEAILAADVAGYSRLMGADEEGDACAAQARIGVN